MAQEGNRRIADAIESFVDERIALGFIDEADRVFFRNWLIHETGSQFSPPSPSRKTMNADLLEEIADAALFNKRIVISQRSDFIDKIAGRFVANPFVVNLVFQKLLSDSSESATDYLYAVSVGSRYVKALGNSDAKWLVESEYGPLTVSVNTSKPEKTPDEIAAARLAKPSNYPKCQLCVENVGLVSTLPAASRYGLRTVDLFLGGEKVFMQYSPYGYFPEHLVVNSYTHEPMLISEHSARQILEFVSAFPHYFLASNSDIPIVGGSILSHRHFQGGRARFPIQDAQERFAVQTHSCLIQGLKWPVSAIRITGASINDMCSAFKRLMEKWYSYENDKLGIWKLSKNGDRQNAVSLFGAFSLENELELYVLFRNNAASEEYPSGVFHAHPEHWNIKRENIGIIEQIGMAILPGRLNREMEQMEKAFKSKQDLTPDLAHHAEWFGKRVQKYSGLQSEFPDYLRKCVGETFVAVLENCGVFKRNKTEEFRLFVESAFDPRGHQD